MMYASQDEARRHTTQATLLLSVKALVLIAFILGLIAIDVHLKEMLHALVWI